MKTNLCTRSIAILLALSMTACGQYKSASPSSMALGKLAGSIQPVDTTAIEKTSAEAQAAMVDAQAALAKVVDANGNVNLFSKASSEINTQFFLTDIKDKIIASLDLVVAKIALVKEKFSMARQQVADAIGKLNPADPAQAAMIAMLTEQLAKVDVLEAKFWEGVHMLAGKLDFALVALDKLSATAGTAAGAINPILGVIVGAASWLIVGQIKDVITHFRDKLMAL